MAEKPEYFRNLGTLEVAGEMPEISFREFKAFAATDWYYLHVALRDLGMLGDLRTYLEKRQVSNDPIQDFETWFRGPIGELEA